MDGGRHEKNLRKMLIVDDSLVTRKLIKRAFEKANFHVDLAVNGTEGLEKMKSGIYDVVFMDLDMPIMNGIDATKMLREWEDVQRPNSRQPICALTSAILDEIDKNKLMELRKAGLNVFESKPANIPRLLRVVDDVSVMFSDLTLNQSGFIGE
jgi:CheY-like chemotaxis protein